MRSLNTLFVAVAAMVVMCLAQVGYAQQQQEIYNLIQILPTPPRGTGYHSNNHTPSQGWELGKVYEKIYGTNNFKNYSGEGTMEWQVYDMYWSPILLSNGTGVTVQGADTSIRTPSGGYVHPGTIYHLIASLDGEAYRGSFTAGSTPRWTAINIWTRNGIGDCPTRCFTLDPTEFNVDNLGFNLGWNFVSSNNIYLPAPANIRLSGFSNTSGIEVYYITANSLASKTITALAHKPTTPTSSINNAGKAVFYIDPLPGEPGYFAMHGNCLHPIPHCDKVLSSCTCQCQTCGDGCAYCNDYVGDISPTTVTVNVKKYDIPLPNTEVCLANTTLTQFKSVPGASTNSSGTVIFSPPINRRNGLTINSGQYTTNPYKYVVYDSTGGYEIPNTYYPSTSDRTDNIAIYPTNVPVLISPPASGVGTYFTPSSTIQFSCGTVSGVSTYVLWLKQGTGNWQGYNLGNATVVNLTGAGLGTWQWEVEGRNSAGLVVACSERRTFIVNQTGVTSQRIPIDPMEMDELLDDDVWLDELLGNAINGSDSLADEEFSSIVVVQDENGNVLSPLSGNELLNALKKKATRDETRARKIIQPTKQLPKGAPPIELKKVDLSNISFEPTVQDVDWFDVLFWNFFTSEKVLLDNVPNWGVGSSTDITPHSHECDGNCSH